MDGLHHHMYHKVIMFLLTLFLDIDRLYSTFEDLGQSLIHLIPTLPSPHTNYPSISQTRSLGPQGVHVLLFSLKVNS